jgi:Glycosyltransferase family 10 (fucosyltransferase) C-term
MGARPEDYAVSLPPHSYIHVDNFRSPRDLADYLHKLDATDSLYNQYYRWKSEWTVFEHSADSYWCRLCGLLHVAADHQYVHWYTNYTRWWDGDQGSSCGSLWVEHNGLKWRTWKTGGLT